MGSSAYPRPMPGERRLFSLLNGLPKREFFFRFQPQIVTAAGASKPDFVVVSALLGVLVIEVKDWRRLAAGTQQSIQIITSDGATLQLPNPILQAEGYAYDLKDRFRARAELWSQRKGSPALRFPWQVMVALPFVPQSDIERFEAAGVWPRGVAIGVERLQTALLLERAIRALPWKFAPDAPLSLDMLDIIRELIDPSLRVDDADGAPVGTLTRAQESLVRERVTLLQPRQAALTGFAAEPLPDEQAAAVENHEVRLVRGVAGSGKTLVLARRARRLAADYPDASFMLLTFNRELARDIRERLGLPLPPALSLDAPDDEDETEPVSRLMLARGLEVRHFHSLCRQILGAGWMRPMNTRRWLTDHAGAELEALGMTSAAAAEELAWRRERGLDDEAYLTADRRGRGYALDHGRRSILNQVAARLAEAKQARQARGLSGFDWDDVPFRVEDVLARPDHPLVGRYESILIDEGQDFTPSWMRIVYRLLRPGGALFICDDPSQSIFHNYNWSQKGVSVIGRTMLLKVPFRSTMEISAAAHRLVEVDDILRGAEERSEPDLMTYELGRGPLPALVEALDPVSEADFVAAQVDVLLSGGVHPRQIAILCHRYEEMFRWKALESRGVYVQFFERMKGLEFINVFVPGLDGAFDQARDAETIAAMRRKVFTAMTRARYRLVLSSGGPLPAPLHALREVMLSASPQHTL